MSQNVFVKRGTSCIDSPELKEKKKAIINPKMVMINAFNTQ